MKLVRMISIVAGLLLAGVAASTMACDKQDSGKSTAAADMTRKGDRERNTTSADKAVAGGDEAAAVETEAADKAVAKEPGGGYTVKITRPIPVGFRYRLISTGKSDVRVEADGQLLPSESTVFSWDYEAEVTVKAVSKDRQSNAEEHKVIKFLVAFEEEAMTPQATKGSLILATVEGDTEAYVVDGKKADERLADVLELITDLDDGNKLDNDAVFGATTPKQVGDTWSIDSEVMASEWERKFKGSDMPVKAVNVAGKVTLAEAKTVEGIAALSFVVAATIKDAAPPMGTIKPTAGNIIITLERWLPADPESIQGAGGTKKLAMHVEGSVVKNGKTIRIATDAIIEGTEKIVAID